MGKLVFVDTSVLLHLHNSIVLKIFEYCPPVWRSAPTNPPGLVGAGSACEKGKLTEILSILSQKSFLLMTNIQS